MKGPIVWSGLEFSAVYGQACLHRLLILCFVQYHNVWLMPISLPWMGR